jgi:hypothetical protein
MNFNCCLCFYGLWESIYLHDLATILAITKIVCEAKKIVGEGTLHMHNFAFAYMSTFFPRIAYCPSILKHGHHSFDE